MGILRGYLLTSIRRRNHFTICSLIFVGNDEELID